MNILSDNEFYTQGILFALDTINTATPFPPDKSPITLYIVTSTAISGISTFLLKKPITEHAVFICNHKIQHFIDRRYPDVIKYFIDENSSVSAAVRILRLAIAKNHVSGTQKIIQDNIQLSEKEIAVLSLLRQGYDIKSIAYFYHVNTKTIYAHKNNAMKKYGAKNLHEFYHFILKTIKPHEDNKLKPQQQKPLN
ncbi:helix-turn-helix transcriptional regulator [Kluyvera sp. STS39-E]|uniref:helix-turn-helix transcriptional regulator n=1 Tax=Kluyvera sp. STS39-E TaxID=3234748 RepID=UPI0034C61C57